MQGENNYWARRNKIGQFNRRRLLVTGGGLSAGLAAFGLVGCGDDSNDSAKTTPGGAAQSSPTQGAGQNDPNAKVIAGFTFVHDTMDPHDVTLPPYGIPFRAMYDGLTYRKPDSSVTGGLAESWEVVAPDTYVFQLRSNAKFHNGDAFTSEDVKATFDRIIADGKPFKSTIGTVKLEVVDPTHVKMTLAKPDALFPQAVADLSILPGRYLESVGGMSGFVKAPVGTGRFKYGEFRGGDLVRVVRVDDGWRDKPNVAEVTMRVIPDNATRIAALQSGQIMIADSLPPESVGQFDGSKDISIEAGLLPNILTVDLMDPACSDVRVRRAINLAVDKESMIKKLFAGKGAVVAQGVGPNAFGYDESLKPIGYDVAEAKKLLEAAGFADGFTTTMTHSTAIAGEPLAAEAVVGFLGQVGIKVNLKTIEPTVRLNNFLKGSPEPLFTWAGGYANLMDAAASLFYYKSNTGYGQVRYKNPAYDTLYDSMRADTDNTSRLAKIKQLDEMIREDLPVLWEFCPASFTGVSTRIFDLEQRGDGHIEFANMKVKA